MQTKLDPKKKIDTKFSNKKSFYKEKVNQND